MSKGVLRNETTRQSHWQTEPSRKHKIRKKEEK